MASRKRVSAAAFIRHMRRGDIAAFCGVFAAYFATSELGHYILSSAQTSPALFWPAYGIALGAILAFGYRMWFPIALAELLYVYLLGSTPLIVLIGATLGQTLQPFLGAYAMREVKFDNSLGRLRDAFVLIVIAFAVTTIAPLLSTLSQILAHTLTVTPFIAFSRSWAGGILSVLIFTPLVTTWFPYRPLPPSSRARTEIIVALLCLSAISAILFGSTLATDLGISGIYILLAALLWIALRMEPRIMALGLTLLTVIGIGGTLLFHPTAAPLNQALFGDELFIEFIAAIFLVFSALIEERRNSRRELEHNITELEKALQRISIEDKTKNEFIATLAHELRNPLAPVVSAFDLLALQNPSREAMDTIESAQRELTVMRRLLDDLLDVARITQGKFKLQKEYVDIRLLIGRCIESTKSFFKNRKHLLSMSLPASPVMLDVDPVRFQQIITNLLNNAGKYTPEGGRIHLSCEKNAASAMIEVRDNGIGIPPASLLEIFEAFRQIRPTPNVGTGLGIGLWLTKRLVEMHGGTITAASEGAQRGSIFTIYFPLVQNTSMQSAEEPKKEPATIRSSYKILIVDDNEAAAEGMKKLLAFKGHDARTAYTGSMALTEIATFLPQIILLDIGLPDMDGYEVARKLRDAQSKATLIALTGYGQEEDKMRAKEAGFDFHLTKPVGIADIETILSTINQQ